MLQDHKHDEMKILAEKNLEDACTYLESVSNNYAQTVKELEEIGDINGRPSTFYDTIEEALKHQNNLESLIESLGKRQQETDPYTEQIEDLKNTALQEITWDQINVLNNLKEHQ